MDTGRLAGEAGEPGPGVVRIPLLLRLASYEQSAAAARAAGASEQQLATLRFRLAYERAVLGWFDELGRD